MSTKHYLSCFAYPYHQGTQKSCMFVQDYSVIMKNPIRLQILRDQNIGHRLGCLFPHYYQIAHPLTSLSYLL